MNLLLSRTALVLSLIMSLYSGCRYFGPRDTTFDTPIRNLSQLKNLVGNWEATSGTYELLREKKYRIDSMGLIFYKDSTFMIVNLPDCIIDGFGNSIRGNLYTTTGKWSLQYNVDYWDVMMDFNKGELFKTGYFMNFGIAISGSKYQLYTYLGDPDEAKAITFEKKIDTRNEH